MCDDAFYLDAELHIIPIGPAHNTKALDVFDGEGGDLVFLVANQAQSPNPTAISEGDVFAIGVKLPAGLFILDAAIIVLKFGIALLPRLVCFAIFIEARNGNPGTISTGLSPLGVEPSSKGIGFGKD